MSGAQSAAGISGSLFNTKSGEAILRYLKARPRCACRNVFVTLQQPYRPVSAAGMWRTVSRRFKLRLVGGICG